MGIRRDTSFLSNGTLSDDARSKLLKRKRAQKVAAHIQRCVAQCRPPKKFRTAESQNLQTLAGSVAYKWPSSDVYGWPAKTLLLDAANVQKSGKPLRFMFFSNTEWKEFSGDVIIDLSQNFAAGNNSVQIDINRRKYIINFLQMMQMNLQTGFLRSIAWVDEHGKHFFPSRFFEGHPTQLLAQLSVKSEHKVPHVHFCQTLDSTSPHSDGHLIPKTPDGVECHGLLVEPRKLVTDIETSSEICSTKVGVEALMEGKFATGPGSQDFTLLGNKVVKLQADDQEYAIVKNKFLAGMGMLVSYTTVANIYRDSHSSTSGQARLQAFQRQEEITKNVRGNANLRFAWHGTSKQAVYGIILHGFGQPKTPKNGTAYGIGVYLAPEDYSHVSAVYSDVDEKGEQHMILCRVIMGNMEQVHPGSEQFHPSSEDHDAGVDDLLNPKRYVIWSTHMNTHILPEYVVSFKISSEWHDVIAALRGKQMTNRGIPLKRFPHLDCKSISERGEEPKHVTPFVSSSCQLAKGIPSDGLFQGTLKKSPRSPWMSFPMLFYVLRSKLSSTDMITLQQCYIEFKVGRMPRNLLIRNVRMVAGDEVLAEAIRSMQAQEQANLNSSSLEYYSNSTSHSSLLCDNTSSAPSRGGCISEVEKVCSEIRVGTGPELGAEMTVYTSAEKLMDDVMGSKTCRVL